jgi:hypothetical protein
MALRILIVDDHPEVGRFVEAVRRVGEGGSVLDPEPGGSVKCVHKSPLALW